jgi:Sugar (and other) transporter
MALPTFALLVINREWSFDIDFLGLTYKPWRLFLVASSLPTLMCGLILMFIIPESPKFVFGQGDEKGALEILRRIYTMNTGKSADTYEVEALIRDEEFGESAKTESQSFFKFMWSETLPLFSKAHRRNILTACFLMFAVCSTANGFWTFLPEILNKASLWTSSGRGPATVCEIFNAQLNQTSSASGQCVDKLEFGTFAYIYGMMVSFGIGYGIMGLIINWAGKLALILTLTISSGIAALCLMFVRVPEVLSGLYIVLILSALTMSVYNASTVELFPTKMR